MKSSYLTTTFSTTSTKEDQRKMAEQTKQDIQDALLRIHAEHPEDWNAFEQASRQVLAQMGTQRAHEENQAVLDTTQGEADTHSSETNSAQNDPRVAMATASSRASAHANVSETHIRPYRCTVPGCGKRYQHVRSRYRVSERPQRPQSQTSNTHPALPGGPSWCGYPSQHCGCCLGHTQGWRSDCLK